MKLLYLIFLYFSCTLAVQQHNSTNHLFIHWSLKDVSRVDIQTISSNTLISIAKNVSGEDYRWTIPNELAGQKEWLIEILYPENQTLSLGTFTVIPEPATTTLKRQMASYTAVASIIVTGRDSKGQNAASEIEKSVWTLYSLVILLLLIN